MAGKLQMIAASACLILEKGLERNYYMEPEKSILICNDSLTDADLAVLQEFTFRRSDGECYVVSYIGSQEKRRE